MKINNTFLPEVYLLDNFFHKDDRGYFVKIFNKQIFKENKLNAEFKESFYSISEKNVIRGMHFQTPPMDHEKLVYVISGSILDVVIDVRKSSPTYGKSIAFDLNEKNKRSLYIGRGFAHGFLTKSKTAIVGYMTTSLYSKEHDTGIKWDSFGFDWGISDPIISQRDANFENLET
ncbi:dTDP-4-dehydrorhamnose 3,5-epimerase [Vreelandella salicampi]|uniref:dTDP-4-dehydrorhamnose 3,5-epimerase n=1 Tax=Vreelandella salicampi TaxID=1449798 RepID=A0A7Z0LIV4_9GAMM|nr:dTDP-4-dehydrorhamnose 3,5-epimerase [Halomonas salicampi]NYS59720.1 dTDP-4-dehydrorhamnose 3,5-epimerase [Halomonas salicampi]